MPEPQPNLASFDYQRLRLAATPCPCCAGGNLRTLARHDRHAMGLHTVQCQDCGLLFTNPRPSAADLAEFYRLHYRRVYGHGAQPTACHQRRYRVRERARHTLDRLDQLRVLTTAGSVLDIGCGDGMVLTELARRRGDVQRVGIEPYEPFAACAREHAHCPVVHDLTDLDHPREPGRAALAPPGGFDLLLLVHVLEHLPDPVGYLRRLAGRVSPAGAIYVDVPDAQAYRSLADLHLAHLCHFHAGTLAGVAQRAGWAATAIFRHAPPGHPRSVAAVLRRTGPSAALLPQPVETLEAAARRITRIDRSARRYHVRRRWEERLKSWGQRFGLLPAE